jgi:hypothetical protein
LASTLDNSCTRKLLSTELMVMDEKQSKLIEQVSDMMKKDNAKIYRAKLADNYENSVPTIPYVGQHLTDLTFAEDGF